MELEEMDEFTERKIIIGLITSDDFIKHVARVYNKNCLESPTARTIANWCIDYYKKYGKAPGKDIEGIYTQKCKEGLQQDKAEWIEDILSSLSEEYEQGQLNTDFLLEHTIEHFKKCSINEHGKRLQTLPVEEAYKLHLEFRPITLSDLTDNHPIRGGDILDMELEKINWLVNDLIPKGLTIIGGAPKAGKSYFVLNLAMGLAQGKRLFGEDKAGGFRGRKGRVLYLCLEDPKSRCQHRMIKIDKTADKELLNKHLEISFTWDKLVMGGLQKIEHWLKRQNQPPARLIIIDTIGKVWNKKASTGGGGAYVEDYAVYAPLADLAHKYNTSIICLIHTKKTKAEDIFDEIYGTRATQATADNLIVLTKENEGRGFYIRGKDIKEQHLFFTTTNGIAKWVYEGEVAEVQKTAQRQEIIDLFLDEERAMGLQEIKEKLKERGCKISLNSVPIILRKMVGDGVLEQQSRYGKYHLAGYAGKKADLKVSQTLGRIQRARLLEETV